MLNWVFPKKRGKTPKMDGLFHGKPYEQIDDLGGFPHYFWKHAIVEVWTTKNWSKIIKNPGMNLANGLEHKRPIFFYKFTVLIAIVTWRLQKKSTKK